MGTVSDRAVPDLILAGNLFCYYEAIYNVSMVRVLDPLYWCGVAGPSLGQVKATNVTVPNQNKSSPG